MKIIPGPGTYIAEEVVLDEAVLTGGTKTRLVKGRIVAKSEFDVTDYGKTIDMPVQVGDIAYFLSYEGDYDWTKIDGKKYYTVLRKDHRFVLKP